MATQGLDIQSLLANLRKRALESQGIAPDADKPPMDQAKLQSIISGGAPQIPPSPPPGMGPTGNVTGNMENITSPPPPVTPPQPGPAMQQFQNALKNEPMRANYEPSGKRKFGAVMAGIGGGILGGLPTAMATYRGIRDQPFNKEVSAYRGNLENLAKQADTENALNTQVGTAELNRAKIKEQEALAGEHKETAAERRSARLKTEAETAPDWNTWQEFQLAKERVAHPAEAKRFDAFELAARARANELGVPVEQLPSTEILKINQSLSDQKKTEKAPDIETRWADAFEREHGRPPSSSEIANFHRAPKEPSIASEAAAGRRTDQTITRLRKPYDKMFSDSSGQLDKINETMGMLSGPTAESGAIAGIKILTAIVSGQGSGVRITLPEINQVAKARGITGDFQSWWQRIQGQTQFTPQQVKELNSVLDGVKDLVNKKQKILDDGIDAISFAGTPEEAAKAESKLRKDLMGLGGGEKMSDQDFLKKLLGK